MLNRKQIISNITSFAAANGHALEDLLVTHGAACVLLGVKDTTNDIDVSTTLSAWTHHVKLGKKPEELADGVLLLSVTDTIDLHVGGPKPFYAIGVTDEGVHYTGFNQTLADYERLNRDKDKEILAVLRDSSDIPF